MRRGEEKTIQVEATMPSGHAAAQEEKKQSETLAFDATENGPGIRWNLHGASAITLNSSRDLSGTHPDTSP